MRRVVTRAVVLLAVGPAVGLAIDPLRSEPLGLVAEVATTCAESSAVEEIDPEFAAQLCSELRALIIDVRSEEDFATGHIPGAMHLPCSAGNLEAATIHLDRADVVLVYGNTTAEASAVAASLKDRGWPTRLLSGGYPAWFAAGLACASGPCAGCERDDTEAHGH